jgi:hypothetical protein
MTSENLGQKNRGLKLYFVRKTELFGYFQEVFFVEKKKNNSKNSSTRIQK